MRYRKLRIAWSVGWGVVAVLLCVLWVRSYRWIDEVGVTGSSTELSVGTFSGFISVWGAPDLYWPRGDKLEYVNRRYPGILVRDHSHISRS